MNKLKFSFGKELPMILQTEIAECGIACIAMIANYHGYETDLLSIRKHFPITQRGTNLQDLINLAKKFNFSSRAVKLELEDLRNLKIPCLLHWDMSHFVVLKKISDNSAIIHDPAVGVIRYTISELSKHFTGIAIEFTPTINFKAIKDRTKLRLADLWSSIKGLKLSMVHIIFISLALEVFAIIAPLYMQFVTDDVILSKDYSLLYVLAVGFGLLIIIQTVVGYARSWIILYLSNTLNIQLAVNLIRHLFKLPISFFEKRHLGDIISRFGSMSVIQEKISTALIESVVDGIMGIVTLIMMLIYSRILSFIVFGALLLYVILRVSLYSAMKTQTQESLVAVAKENSVFIESIRAILPLKIFRKETLRENIWQNSYINKLNSNIRLSKLGMIYQFLHKIIFGIEYVLVVLFGALEVMKGSFSIGMLFAYISYRQQFVARAQSMVDKIIEYKMITLHLERVADIVLNEVEKDDNKNFISKAPIKGDLEVKNMSFKYSEQGSYIFKDLSFNIKAGQSVAIVGPSGCGKTTLIKVMMNLLTDVSGDILVDGKAIDKIGINSYRSQIAAVMQEDILLSGSIAENISFFDDKLDMKRIHAVATLAVIHEDIMQMPMGYESLVGDMGSSLSGGQKQRILLARALYANPKILFLDEATSHLDKNNESIINKNIQKLGITRIIVAHRKETVSMVDKIINLKEYQKNKKVL